MQDVHEILGGVGGGRIFNDRRLRAATAQGLHHQALKCPRCDSLNTKFCYYNNYNLSQPRHFCKNCRRYWTKGGVLRNVPVGGGCRKSKRSTKRKASVSPPPAGKDGRNSGSLSSSESTSKKPHSSGLGVAKSASEAGSEHSSFKFSDPPPATFNFTSPPPIGGNSSFDPLSSLQAGAGGLIGDGFGQIGTAAFGVHQQNQPSNSNQVLLQNLSARSWQKEKFNGVGDDWAPGMFDQTVYVDGALAGAEWHGVSGGGGGHLGMFDLTPGSDWSQSSQWNESDHHLYLPP